MVDLLSRDLEDFTPQASPSGEQVNKSPIDDDLLDFKPQSSVPAIPPPDLSQIPPVAAPMAPAPAQLPPVEVAQEFAEPSVLDADLADFGVKPERAGFAAALSGGLQRGGAQVLSTPATLAGIYAEATGDAAGADAAYADVQAIEAMAPKAQIGGLENIYDLEDTALWATETFAEFAPVMLSMFTGAGAGAGAAKLAGRGLLANAAKRRALTRAGASVGGAGSGIALETAGTGQELKGATGSFQPATTITAGAVKGVLEWYAPYSVGKRLLDPDGTVGKALLRGAATEAITEGAQETVDVLARAMEDQSYQLFSSSTGMRIVNAMAAGTLVGGGLGAGGQATVNALGAKKPAQSDVPQEVLADLAAAESAAPTVQPEAPSVNEVEPELPLEPGDTPLRFLRKFAASGKDLDTAEVGIMQPDAAGDVMQSRSLFRAPMFEREMVRESQRESERILDLADASVPRYAAQRPDGSWTNPMTDTDLEAEMSSYPQSYRPDIREMDLSSMSPAGITADLWDLPKVNSPRVTFMPWVTPEARVQLGKQYNALAKNVRASQPMRMRGAVDTSLPLEEYTELVAQGLRVVPSRGASFMYSGEAKGTPVRDFRAKRLAPVVVQTPRTLLDMFKPQQEMKTLTPQGMETRGVQYADPFLESTPVTLDANKYEFEDGYAYHKVRDISAEFILSSQLDKFVFRKDITDPRVKQDLAHQLALVANASHLTGSMFEFMWKRGIALNPRTVQGITHFAPQRQLEASKLIPGLSAPLQKERKYNMYTGGTQPAQKLYFVPDNPAATQEDKDIVQSIRTDLVVLRQALSRFAAKHGLADDVVVVIVPGGGMNDAYYNPTNNSIMLSTNMLKGFGQRSYPGKLSMSTLAKQIIIHEYGHYISTQYWSKLPSYAQDRIYAGYEKALVHARLTRDHWKTTGSMVSPPEYGLLFSEYLAEQFRRWSLSVDKGRSLSEKFFQSVGSMREELFANYEQLLGPKAAREATEASWEFASVMDYLESLASGKSVDRANFAAKAKAMPMDVNVGIGLTAVLEASRKAIQEFGGIFPSETTFEVDPNKLEIGNAIVDAEYIPSSAVVRLWAGSMADYTDVGIVRQRLIHEGGHALWPWLTEQEKALVVAEGTAAKLVNVPFYSKFYRQHGQELGLEGAELDLFVADNIAEEQFAHLLEKRLEGVSYTSPLNQLLDRVILLIQQIKEMLGLEGHNSIDSLLRAIRRGEVAARASKAEQAALRSEMSWELYAADLDRSPDARTKRAKELGFDTSKVWYHGSPTNSIEAFEGYPHFGTQEAANDRLDYLGLLQEEAVQDDPSIADQWNTAIYPVYLRVKKSLELEDLGDWKDSDIAWALNKRKLLTPEEYTAIKNGELDSIDWIKSKGYDAITYRNDFEGSGDVSIMVLDPVNVRSVNAQFDPGQSGSSNIRAAADVRVGKSRNENFDVAKIEPLPGTDLYVATEYVGGKNNAATVTYHLYQASKGPLTGSLQSQLDQLGRRVGEVELVDMRPQGYEVQFVNIYDEFQKRGYAKAAYAYASADLGITMMPSGVLYPDGYAMWKARRAEWVKYHIPVDMPDGTFYYSPKRIRENLSRWQVIRAKAKKFPQLYANAAQVEASYQKWKKAYDRVNPKAWTDPLLKKMYAASPKDTTLSTIARAEQGVADTRRTDDMQDGKLVEAITGEREPSAPDAYAQIHRAATEASQAENAKILGIPEMLAAARQPESSEVYGVADFLRKGENNAEVRKILGTLGPTTDRITKFSKNFLGIQQMAWRNPNIKPLQDFVATAQTMTAYRMRWINQADPIARRWDKLAPEQRDGMADLLFWLTEMNYRTPQEMAADIVRQPTQQDLLRGFQMFKITPDAQVLYADIRGQFENFLNEVEIISRDNIARTLAANPQGLAQALAKLTADMAAMRQKPYFPMTRFGRWSITVRDQQTNVVELFSTYATERERDAALKQMAGSVLGQRVQIGKVPDAMLEFMGLPGPLIDQILDPAGGLPGITPAQKLWLEQFKLHNAPENSFRKRWLERKGTPGYSLDAFRVFSHYFQTGSNYLAKLKYKDDLRGAVRETYDTIKAQPDGKKRTYLYEMMNAQAEYILEGGKDFGKLRSLISMWQLGFSPAAALMNLTQIPTVMIPYFSGLYGNGVAEAATLKNLGKLRRSTVTSQSGPMALAYEAARQELQSMGKIEVGQAAELGAYAEGSNLIDAVAGTATQKAYRDLTWLSMWGFGKMEGINREVTFATSWDLSQRDPHSAHNQELELRNLGEIARIVNTTYDVNGVPTKLTYDQAVAVIAAREAIDRTQFVFQPWARPKFLQNKWSGLFLVFFGYMQSMLYAFGNNPGRVKMILIYAALYGLMGLPGADDMDELLKMLSRLTHKMFGADFSIESNAREFARNITRGTVLDQVGPDLFLHGLSRYSFGLGLVQEGYGVPQFDASANGSMGNIVPGVAQLAQGIGTGQKWTDTLAYATKDMAGAGVGQMFALMQFLQSDPMSADRKAWEKIMPRFAKAASRGYGAMVTGEVQDNQGATLAKFDVTNADDLATLTAYMLGFSPTKVNAAWDAKINFNDETKWLEGRRTAIMAQMDQALRSEKLISPSDRVQVPAIKQRILAFNAEMRQRGLGAMSITPEGLMTSLQNRNRRRASESAGLPPKRSLIPLRQQVLDQYPGVAAEIESRKVK